jgi:gamma-glutamyl hercynylcysteine S-oxide synthase
VTRHRFGKIPKRRQVGALQRGARITRMVTSNLTPLLDSLREARDRTLALVADLDDEQMIGPHLAIVNPLRWEIAHVAWFQEFWLLRHLLGRLPVRSTGDSLYDSAKVAHDTRWDLRLPSKAQTIAYTQTILDRVLDEYQSPDVASKDASYFLSLALFHEDMHAEAITYTRQTLGYSAPQFTQTTKNPAAPTNEKLGDAFISGGTFVIGSTNDQSFAFDNELRAHEVHVESFSISRAAVTNAEFSAFVDDQGYERRELWSDNGWQWRESTGAKHPVYWKSIDSKWWRRNFDQMVPLEGRLPVIHVNWYEAEAFCRWARRRLPSEAEWELAATASDKQHANLNWQSMGPVDATSLPEGDSVFGCRQMIGNVWEWTSSDFLPYPGFVAGPYKEYSEPWFGDHKVLRGGCWTTRSRLIHNAYRNFYKPDRRDVWGGFRTCAL